MSLITKIVRILTTPIGGSRRRPTLVRVRSRHADGFSYDSNGSDKLGMTDINPASGLPMVHDTGIDIEGNPFDTYSDD